MAIRPVVGGKSFFGTIAIVPYAMGYAIYLMNAGWFSILT